MLAAAGCTLAEVVTEVGQDVVVVEAVLRAGQSEQRILLHRSLLGDVIRGEPGARVLVRSAAGEVFEFFEAPGGHACIAALPAFGGFTNDATCYVAQPAPVRAGETYWLEVETARGERLRGRTEVPGAFAFVHREPGTDGTLLNCLLEPATPLQLVWSRAAGAWSYIAALEVFYLRTALAGSGIANIPEVLELTGLAIGEGDTSIVVPTDFGIFERLDHDAALLELLQGGFPAGTAAHVVIAAADRNYVNGVRGGRFNPSGNVRTSSIVGPGVGVFGAVTPIHAFIGIPERSVAGGRPPCSPAPQREPPGPFAGARGAAASAHVRQGL